MSRRSESDRSDRRHRAKRKTLDGLYARYYPTIRHYFAEHTSSDQDADDLAQEVFLRLSSKPNLPKDPEAYALTIARHLLREYHKKSQRRARTVLIEWIEGVTSDYTTDASRPDTRPDLAEELNRIIKSHHIRLSPKALEAIRLTYLEGLAAREAAKRIGCSTEALYKRLQRARKLLRESRAKEQAQP